ncbi:hypothetical protein ACT691_17965 [Vibrio metschnikovii]
MIQSPIRELTQLRGEKRLTTFDRAGDIDIGGRSMNYEVTLPWGSELRLMKNRLPASCVIHRDEQSRTSAALDRESS